MWRDRRNPATEENEPVEMYFDRIIPTLRADGEDVIVVGVGPRVPFKRRGALARRKDILEVESKRLPYRPLRSYFTPSLGLSVVRTFFSCWKEWRRFQRLPRLADALSHHSVSLVREGSEAFREAFLRLLPWAMGSFLELRELLAWEKPDVMVLYAESTALGRAAVAASSDVGIPSFAIQHGIMYPNYYSHEHASDEVGPQADGSDTVPLPTRTAVYGSMARDLLVQRGKYPSERLVITGSPRFDALLSTSRLLSREEIRKRLNLQTGTPLLVVASRFASIGPVFLDLVRAASVIPELWLLVKPHQAEGPESYLEVAAKEEATRVRVVPSSENLLELLFASDGLITVDSFASSEALVLGRPVLVVNLPSNLQMLVDRGMALGVLRGEDMVEPIRRLLNAPRWTGEERTAFEQEFAYGADGGCTRRIIQAIWETADISPN
jgi:hypothetical protein